LFILFCDSLNAYKCHGFYSEIIPKSLNLKDKPSSQAELFSPEPVAGLIDHDEAISVGDDHTRIENPADDSEEISLAT
jgi:hypothetical protein